MTTTTSLPPSSSSSLLSSSSSWESQISSFRIETERLTLRVLQDRDAAFIAELLNEEAFVRFIGDRGVRNEADALKYIARQRALFIERGLGLFAVVRNDRDAVDIETATVPIGICGLVLRAELDGVPDIGFAFLQRTWSYGYATESSNAVLQDSHERLRLPRVLAVVLPSNERSVRLLQRLGMQLERPITLHNDELHLYAIDLCEAATTT